MRGRHSNITVREGTSEKNWYFLASYVAVGLLGVVGTLVTLASTWGDGGQAWGTSFGIVLVVLSLGGLAVYPAIFRDSAYLRGTRSRWRPKWWNYLLGGLGVPVGAFFLVAVAYDPSLGIFLAFLLHAFSASIAAGHYLYRRHEHIGVP